MLGFPNFTPSGSNTPGFIYTPSSSGYVAGFPMSSNPGGSDGFTPITFEEMIRQVIINKGDIAEALGQAAIADTNHNRIFDTAKEYDNFNKYMEHASSSYSDIDYSALKPSPTVSYDDSDY